MDRPTRDQIEAYLRQCLPAEEYPVVEAYIRDHPDDSQVVAAFEALWNRLSESESPEIARAAFERFGRVTCRPAPLRRPALSAVLRIVRNAAAILVLPLLASAFWLWSRYEQTEPSYLEYAVAQGQTDSLRLPDNTLVWLNAGSRIIYPERFGRSARQVFFSGEGYFDVAREADKPFVLTAGGVRVQVLGTQFNITSYEEMKSVSVSLIEGSVRMDVDYRSAELSMILAPGDVVRYDKTSGELQRNRFQTDAYCSWRHGGFYFNNQPLSEIMAHFERIFRVRISILDAQLYDTHFSLAFVNRESLEEMLAAISRHSRMHIEYNDDMIVITKNKPMPMKE